MQAMPLREMRGPLAREVSELLLIQEDLVQAIAALKLHRDRLAPPDEPEETTRIIKVALMRDAITQFIGCIGSGDPIVIEPEAVYGPVNGGMKYFMWLKNLRDTWAAHRLGPLSQTVVGMIVHPETGEFMGIGKMLNRYQGPSLTEQPSVIDFIQIAARYVATRLEDVARQLEAEACALSPNQRLALPIAKTFHVHPDEVRMGRKKFGNIRRAQHRKRK